MLMMMMNKLTTN